MDAPPRPAAARVGATRAGAVRAGRGGPRASAVRRASSVAHLWVGLALGGVLVVLSVTGSALVFRAEIDRALNPGLLRVEPGPERAPLGSALAGVHEAEPRLVRLPRTDEAPHEVWLGDGRRAYVDPYSGAVLGVRGDDEGAVNVLFAVHAELLGGETGEAAVGVIGLLTVLVAGTGLVLWWPAAPTVRRVRRRLAVAWRGGRWRLNYDLHRAGGAYTAAFLVLVAATGSALVFYAEAGALLHAATRSAPPPPPPTASGGPLAPDVLDGALAAAQRALPDGEPTFVTLPQSPDAPLTVRLRTPGEWHPNGRSYVHLEPATGRVLRADDARAASPAARALYAAYPLHVGAVGGGAVRALYAVLGLAPAVLSVTGVLVWYRRWRRRDRAVRGGPARADRPARSARPARRAGTAGRGGPVARPTPPAP